MYRNPCLIWQRRSEGFCSRTLGRRRARRLDHRRTFEDNGISGAKGRDQRPAFDQLHRAITRREIDVVMAWSVDRLGRSLQDLVGLPRRAARRRLRPRTCTSKAIDTTTPAGRALFQMLGVFAEFERAIIVERVRAGIARARAEGKHLGRPRINGETEQAIRAALADGKGIRKVARECGVGVSAWCSGSGRLARRPRPPCKRAAQAPRHSRPHRVPLSSCALSRLATGVFYLREGFEEGREMSRFQTSTRRARGTTRRTFLRESTGALTLTTMGPALPELFAAEVSAERTPAAGGLPLTLVPEALAGGLVKEAGAAPLARAVWYSAAQEGASLSYRFPKGALARARYLSADLLVDSVHLTVFQLRLFEAEADGGRVFKLTFGVLPQCSARMRMLMEAVLQNRWQYPREGAWLKPHPRGDRVDLAQVDRLTIAVLRKSAPPTRFCLTPLVASVEEPALLSEARPAEGSAARRAGAEPLARLAGRSANAAEVTARLVAQRSEAPQQRWPEGWCRWGGLARTDASRHRLVPHARTTAKRSWLVDPDGHPFWSAGLDCVRVDDTAAAYGGLEKALTWLPDANGAFRDASRPVAGGETPHVNYLAANFIRAFGAEGRGTRSGPRSPWAQLRRLGFNTVANWSDWEIAQTARLPLRPAARARVHADAARSSATSPTCSIPRFEEEPRAFAQQLARHARTIRRSSATS